MSSKDIFSPTREESKKNCFSLAANFVVRGIGRGISFLCRKFCGLLPEAQQQRCRNLADKCRSFFSSSIGIGLRAGSFKFFSGIALIVTSAVLFASVGPLFYVLIGAGVLLSAYGIGQGVVAYRNRVRRLKEIDDIISQGRKESHRCRRVIKRGNDRELVSEVCGRRMAELRQRRHRGRHRRRRCVGTESIRSTMVSSSRRGRRYRYCTGGRVHDRIR